MGCCPMHHEGGARRRAVRREEAAEHEVAGGQKKKKKKKWQGATHHWQGFSPEELGSFSKEEDFLTTLSKSHVFPSLLPQ